MLIIKGICLLLSYLPASHTTVRAVSHTAVPIFGYHSRYSPIKMAHPAFISLPLFIALIKIELLATHQ